jgi:hypothetical protein
MADSTSTAGVASEAAVRLMDELAQRLWNDYGNTGKLDEGLTAL